MSVSSAAGLIGATVLLSRLLGFVRDAIIAAMFGQGALVSAYRYAFTLPDTLWMLIAGGAMYAAYVPVITDYLTKGEDEKAWKTFSIVFTFLLVVLLIVIPLCWIFAHPLVAHFIAPGFLDKPISTAQGVVRPLELTVRLTRIVLPAQYFFFLGSLMMGMLQSRKRFLLPALSPIIYNLGIIIGGGIGGRQFGIEAFSWGALIGAFIGSFALQVWAIRALKPKFQWSMNLRFEGVRRCGRLVLPVIFGVSLPQADTYINGLFVAVMPAGKAILDNTNRLMQLPLGVFGQALGIAVLPTLSERASLRDMEGFKDTLNLGMRLVLFLTIPSTILMILMRGPFIHLVYQRGAFHASDTAAAAPVLFCYALGIPAWSLQAVVARGFYGLHDTWTPVICGTLVTFLVFVPLNFLLIPIFHVPGTAAGTRGPALATSIAATVHALALLVLMQRRVGGVHGRRLLRSMARIGVASVPMAMAGFAAERYLTLFLGNGGLGALSVVALGGGASAVVYVAIAHLLHSEEVDAAKAIVRSRLRRA